MAKNHMTEEYYNDHVTLCEVLTYENANQGIHFVVNYKFSIDWFETLFEEGFLIWLRPSYLLDNPDINLPAETLLSESQISNNIDNPYNFSNRTFKVCIEAGSDKCIGTIGRC